MNFNTIGNLIFDFFNVLVIILFSIIVCILTFSIFYFPLLSAIIVTIQDHFIYHKSYFYKTFFKTFLYVTKKYFRAIILFDFLFLLINFLIYFNLVNPVPLMFTIGLVISFSVFYSILLVSANICTLEQLTTKELISKSTLLIKKHINFIFVILVLTFALIYLFLHIAILYFIFCLVAYVIVVSLVLEYGIIINYRPDNDIDLEQ